MSEAVALLEEQPDLFDLSMLPIREDLVAMVQARSFLTAEKVKVFTHSGKIVIARLKSDEELCTALCMALRAGMSERLVARRFSISTYSIAPIKAAMTDRGELASVRIRVDRLLDQFVEAGLERVVEGIQSGEIHPGQLPIAVLAAYDKKAQRDAGMVSGTTLTPNQVTAADLAAQIAIVKQLTAVASDAGSDALPVKQAQISEVSTLDTGMDTAKALPEAVLVPAVSQGDQAGGGDRPAPGGPHGRGLTSETSNP